ncbi:hypothetical protein CAEBREN_11907 [Caenorhabditis brenneri]|uniref:F-box domain-containing protein n=1 Tax=Caenorhabditis brenneri TaxID=135651 RepID=G0PJY5_CAEBE|nr:hypothetical protein CAEBREN_11907 [Caenorhabditis brenneri]
MSGNSSTIPNVDDTDETTASMDSGEDAGEQTTESSYVPHGSTTFTEFVDRLTSLGLPPLYAPPSGGNVAPPPYDIHQQGSTSSANEVHYDVTVPPYKGPPHVPFEFSQLPQKVLSKVVKSLNLTDKIDLCQSSEPTSELVKQFLPVVAAITIEFDEICCVNFTIGDTTEGFLFPADSSRAPNKSRGLMTFDMSTVLTSVLPLFKFQKLTAKNVTRDEDLKLLLNIQAVTIEIVDWDNTKLEKVCNFWMESVNATSTLISLSNLDGIKRVERTTFTNKIGSVAHLECRDQNIIIEIRHL